MSIQISTNNIESYISDLLDDRPDGHEAKSQERIDNVVRESCDATDYVIPEPFVLPEDDKYLSFAIAGSDFLIAANQVISVKSFVNEQGYRDYSLYRPDALLNISPTMEPSSSQFVLILRGEPDYAISVDTVHGLVTVPAERLLIRKKIKDRPWYTAISRDFQSALLNSHTLGKSLCGH